MSNRRRGAAHLVSAFVALASLAACAAESEQGRPSASAADTTTVTATSADRVTEGSLGGVSLLQDTAEQLDRVGLGGLDGVDPARLTELVATFEFADGNWWGARVLVDGDGPYLLAPLYPSDPGRGGSLVLHVSDGEHTSAALDE